MARDVDGQLLESVRVRRNRLREAFLHGSLRTRRTASDNMRRVVFSAIAAAIACAGCAGTSFVKAHIHDSSTAPDTTTLAPKLSRTS
jgi:hypothetical protein